VSGLSRRQLLALCGTGACAVVAGEARAAGSEPPRDPIGMLYDTTKCIGCKSCVVACSEANDLPPDTRMSGGIWQMPTDLDKQTKNIIQLFKDDESGRWSFMKRQCMHCLVPSCVSGCPFKALTKDERGIVSWNPTQCIGCRYCEIACPFQVPKFEWDRINPKIVKCEFCRHLLDEQGEPSCTKVCPTHAVKFGRREDLLREAHERIAAHPGTYHEDRVYGETDAGGLQVLYLSHVPFEDIGLPKLGDRPVEDRTRKVHRWLTRWAMFPIVSYVVLFSFVKRNWKAHDEKARAVEAAGGPRDQR
jgi:Fe-S-cluster-containing dehydrogenase component